MSEKIRFAFSSQICPKSDLDQLASTARELGYAGVALSLLGDDALGGFLRQTPANVRAPFDVAGIKLVSIATRATHSGQKSKDLQLADVVKRLIATAAELGCGSVQVVDPKLKTGQSTADLIQQTAEWLLPLADAAGRAGVELLVRNANALNRSRDLWALLDYSVHPSLGVAWDQLAALPELPAVSISTLNARLRLPILRDASVSKGTLAWKKLGEGDLQVAQAVSRLQGIGFSGFAIYEMPSVDNANELLKDSIAKLKEWIKPKESPKPKPAPKPAAAKPAGAPAAAKPAAATPAAAPPPAAAST